MAGEAKGGAVVPLRQKRACPICGKASVNAFHPFCSRRCADIDLNRWLSGRYAIPAADTDEGDGEASAGAGEGE